MRTDRFLSQEMHPGLTLPELEYQVVNWRMDGEIRQLSPNTLANRRIATEKLIWFLQDRGFDRCGPVELRTFFVYLNSSHETPSGR